MTDLNRSYWCNTQYQGINNYSLLENASDSNQPIISRDGRFYQVFVHLVRNSRKLDIGGRGWGWGAGHKTQFLKTVLMGHVNELFKPQAIPMHRLEG